MSRMSVGVARKLIEMSSDRRTGGIERTCKCSHM